MDKKALYNLLRKYLDQTCTAEEKNMIDEWLELLQDARIFEAYTPKDLETIHSQIWQKIQEQTYYSQPVEQARKSFYFPPVYRWIAAASFIAVIAITAIYINRNSVSPQADYLSTIIPASGMVRQDNTSGEPLALLLEDSSKVVLQPGAMLSYPAHFAKDKRQVYLEGEALFDVTKRAKQPFFIYHNKLVTHVLGTSFVINTRKVNKQVEVSVLRGRVEVSENKQLLPVIEGSKENGVLLTPNQKVIYSEENRMFVASIVDRPLPLKPEATSRFEFENTELTQVLQLVSDEYAVEIVVENDNINKCTFTGSIEEKDMFDKLDIVCRSINCSYELRGTTILLKGPGCD